MASLHTLMSTAHWRRRSRRSSTLCLQEEHNHVCLGLLVLRQNGRGHGAARGAQGNNEACNSVQSTKRSSLRSGSGERAIALLSLVPPPSGEVLRTSGHPRPFSRGFKQRGQRRGTYFCYNRAAIGLACAQAKGRSRLTRAHHQSMHFIIYLSTLSAQKLEIW